MNDYYITTVYLYSPFNIKAYETHHDNIFEAEQKRLSGCEVIVVGRRCLFIFVEKSVCLCRFPSVKKKINTGPLSM